MAAFTNPTCVWNSGDPTTYNCSDSIIQLFMCAAADATKNYKSLIERDLYAQWEEQRQEQYDSIIIALFHTQWLHWLWSP